MDVVYECNEVWEKFIIGKVFVGGIVIINFIVVYF